MYQHRGKQSLIAGISVLLVAVAADGALDPPSALDAGDDEVATDTEPTVSAFAAHLSDAPVQSKLAAPLPDVLDNAGDDELIPIRVVMREQVPRERIRKIIGTIKDRDARYRVTKELLKSLADEAQKEILSMLQEEQDNGLVGPRIRTLWLTNVVAVEATEEVVRQIPGRCGPRAPQPEGPRVP